MSNIDGILDGETPKPAIQSSQDTRRFRRQSVLSIHNEERVLSKIEELLAETPLISFNLRVTEDDKVDLLTHPVFDNRNIKVYLMPIDYSLPGGIQQLVGRMNDNSKIVYLTDKPAISRFSPFKPLTFTERNVECYVGVSTRELLDGSTTEKFKQFLQYLVDYNPLNVLIVSPPGYERMEQNIRKYFSSLHIDPHIDKVETSEKAKELLNQKHYDEIRLPKSFRDYPEDMDKLKGASLNKRMWILFGSRDNGVYFIGNMEKPQNI